MIDVKVYELITELSKLPAGSEVEFRTIMTLEEFSQCIVADDVNGKDGYLVSGTIQEVDVVNEKLVALYR